MNLIENEEYTKQTKRSKTIMMIIIVFIVLLLILSIGLMYMIYDIQKNMVKLTVDTKSIANFSEDMFLFEGENVYVSIKDFAKLVGYEVYNGDHTSEDTTKGYIQNTYEEASFTLNSDKLYKTLLTSSDNEYFDIDSPVKMQNNKLYMSLDGIKIATNTSIGYNASNKQFTVYTLPYLTKYYTQQFNDSAVGDEKADFSNQKALLYNMIVVKNANGNYGVRNLNKQEIIGTKYTSIKFIESTKEFIVTTDDRKMGILLATGDTKIQPNYDDIKQIDKNLNLYLVKNNNKYGVINQNGNIVIFLEYDKIGIDIAQFTSNQIKNQYILFDNCIPVQRDRKWGLFDKTGKQIVPLEYDGLGCVIGTQSSRTANNLLIIPEYEGIVVEKNKKFGIIDSVGKKLIDCVLDSVYSITSSGKDTYYMVQNETTVEAINWFERHGIKPKYNLDNNMDLDENQNTNTTGNKGTTNEIVNNTTNAVAENTVTQNTISTNTATNGNVVANSNV